MHGSTFIVLAAYVIFATCSLQEYAISPKNIAILFKICNGLSDMLRTSLVFLGVAFFSLSVSLIATISGTLRNVMIISALSQF